MPTPGIFDLALLDKQTVAEGVVRLTLGRPDQSELPGWTPGAHIDLHVGENPAMIRQFVDTRSDLKSASGPEIRRSQA